MLRAAMPEAPVDENGKFGASENYVGAPAHTGNGRPIDPETKPHAV